MTALTRGDPSDLTADRMLCRRVARANGLTSELSMSGGTLVLRTLMPGATVRRPAGRAERAASRLRNRVSRDVGGST